MLDFPINYLAVVVAALATILIGALWYSPLLFHKQWVKAHGYTEEKVAEMQKTAGKSFLVSFFCYLVMAFVLAVLVSHLGVTTLLHGALLGLLVWAGFLATLGLTAHLFSEKPFSVYLLDTAYQLVYGVVMGAILGAWQ